MRFLLRGLPGHPLHPPLTDATIGAYTFAAAMAVLSRLGVSGTTPQRRGGSPSSRGSRQRADRAHGVRRLARHQAWHAALANRNPPSRCDVGRDRPVCDHGRRGPRRLRRPLGRRRVAVLTLIGFGVLALGGWLGGANVFVHGPCSISSTSRPRSPPRRHRTRRRRKRRPRSAVATCSSPSCFSIAAFGCAPIAAAAGSPSLKRTIVGIEAIP